MSNEGPDWPLLGKVLLSIGGAVLVGKIISMSDDEESTRETPRSKKGSKKKIKRVQRTLKIEFEEPTKKGKSPGGSHNQTTRRIYPDFYYDLSKGQQYKFRKKQLAPTKPT